jgi:hypothetical protein
VVGVPHSAEEHKWVMVRVDHQDLTGRDIHIEVVQSRNKGQGLFLDRRIMLLMNVKFSRKITNPSTPDESS